MKQVPLITLRGKLTAIVYQTGTDSPCSHGLNLYDERGDIVVGFYLDEATLAEIDKAIKLSSLKNNFKKLSG